MVKNATASGQESTIRALCDQWAKAVSEADIPQLSRLMVDDVVVVHGDGRCLSGRESVIADLTEAFKKFCVIQRVEPQETIVAGKWAFDRSRVHTTIIAANSGKQWDIHSHTLTILRKEEPNGWLVARVIGVVEKPER